MNRIARVGVVTLIAFGLVAALAYLYRFEILLTGASIAASKRVPVGPRPDFSWSSGADPMNRSASDRPPNIVLILADDLGWNDLSINGGREGATVETPNIDSIAAEGVNFVNGYAGNATCAPSRAALLSGRYSTRFGFEFTPTPAGMMQIVPRLDTGVERLRRPILHDEEIESAEYEDLGMPASEITIAELLADRGYYTAHVGKWHVGRTNGMAPHDQGFEESLLMESGLYLPVDDPGVVNSKQSFDPIDQFLWAAMRFAASWNGSSPFAPEKYITDYYTDQAVEIIESNKNRPFFLYLAHWAPHSPLQATREDYDALSHIQDPRERVYAAMIRSLDRGVGRVLKALREKGLEENTLVLFSSDNGGAGYLGLPNVNRPYRGWKMTLFEGGLHVPFFAKWPSRLEPGTVVTDPVHHFDLFSTAAAAGGAALPTDREIDGVDLIPFATGGAEGVPHESLFWRSGASQSALVSGWKLNVSDPPGREWLFDLEADPYERNDLSQSRPDKLAELRVALARHNAQQANPAWPPKLSSGVNLDKDLSHPDAPGDEYIYWTN